MTDQKIFISVFPNPEDELPLYDNPFIYLTYKDIAKKGVKIIKNDGHLSVKFIFHNRNTIDVLHFHWSNSCKVIELVFYLVKLYLARLMGFKLVLTEHNFYQHDLMCGRNIFKILNYIEFKIVHKILALSTWQKKILVDNYRLCETKIRIVKHGNYLETIDGITKDRAREKIGIKSDNLVFIFFGSIFPYKGVDDLVKVFKKRKEMLLITGKVKNEEYKTYIEALCNGASNIRLAFKAVPNSELHALISASDIVVLPFKEIDNSGTIVMAQSFGKPIITRDLPSTRSITSPESTKYFSSEEDLERILDEIKKCDIEKMGKCSFEFVKEQTFSKTQDELVDIYKEIL